MSNPSMQNIPTHTEEGTKIKKALPYRENPIVQALASLAFELEKEALDLYQQRANREGISRDDAKIRTFAELYGGNPDV